MSLLIKEEKEKVQPAPLVAPVVTDGGLGSRPQNGPTCVSVMAGQCVTDGLRGLVSQGPRGTASELDPTCHE